MAASARIYYENSDDDDSSDSSDTESESEENSSEEENAPPKPKIAPIYTSGLHYQPTFDRIVKPSERDLTKHVTLR